MKIDFLVLYRTGYHIQHYGYCIDGTDGREVVEEWNRRSSCDSSHYCVLFEDASSKEINCCANNVTVPRNK